MKTIFKCVAGSKAYGTDLPHSDTDYRGVFVLPNDYILGNKYSEQISLSNNDDVSYEVKRFLQLAANANPNILELMWVSDDCVEVFTPQYAYICAYAENFLTKACARSFGGYAIAQIKKARGLNKKIVKPQPKERKTPLHFCYKIDRHKSVNLADWFYRNRLDQKNFGLVKVPNAEGVYCMINKEPCPELRSHFNGLIKENSNELRVVSTKKEDFLWHGHHIIHYNKDAYTQHCKEWKSYQEWVKNRNPDRYNDNAKHGKGYDGKNLMHCFRLLDMALEIAQEGKITVKRPNREELLSIRRGEHDYDELIEKAEDKIIQVKQAFEKSDLPERVDPELVHELLVDIRNMG